MGTSPPKPVVELVERPKRNRKSFLSLDHEEEQLPEAGTPHERESLMRTIAATDSQIDALVYELYVLTASEVQITEEPALS
jgi:hypothetical protein